RGWRVQQASSSARGNFCQLTPRSRAWYTVRVSAAAALVRHTVCALQLLQGCHTMAATCRAAHRLLPWMPMLLVSGGLLLTALAATSLAQVPTALTPDATLGTTVTRNGPVYSIAGGTRPGNGPN